ncbi:NAD-dependent epimerase/dehydratase family protein [Ramlibacter albus]|uniref:NAD(P)-dependent oxidoreductase n=1 Tax=Ramlibacter albus TaxID=2079448 RepID=A0A923M3R5_9BURK|nr:NAD(P)-dependent oxidoreductase [Ramlibacter albus]MBC5763632.1 NAD(P)-dependent oxidoreductase [Ramlibacter albus]
MKRVLLTGATGFFGRALLRHWAASSEPPQVIGLSRDPQRFFLRYPEFRELEWLELAGGDIVDMPKLRALPAFDAVIHAATDSTLGPKRPRLALHDEIVGGTRNVLDLAVERGVKRMLLTSSGMVYGRLPASPAVPEDWAGAPDPLEPANVYACAKRAAEHLCMLYGAQHVLEVVVARCFAFVGEDLPLDVHYAAGNFIRDALTADAIRIGGDGRSVRSYMDQRDLAHWLLTLLEKGRAGRAYNVGSGRAVTIAELAQAIVNAIAPGKPVHILGAGSPTPPTYYVPDVSRARDELGLTVTIELEQAVRDTAAALRRRDALLETAR